jgi:hypothetical protein
MAKKSFQVEVEDEQEQRSDRGQHGVQTGSRAVQQHFRTAWKRTLRWAKETLTRERRRQLASLAN